MQRIIGLIAILFAFASLVGPALAHAHRYESTPIVVLNHVDAANVSRPVIVTVQKGNIDLGSGIIMPCGPYFAIPVEVFEFPAAQERPFFERAVDAVALDGPKPSLLRPPRAA
ncbi:hypothetical protein IC608_12440 [Devosia sp. PTR5]|uniref:Uncharacterized protein n=1 Tax=Devosia oryzisoli TaxID=2774138 RepID=A0A927FX58_9HYPH|nr:hypothetical protein [Devosia oryzisoli]MBD8066279.1 hypothetical protein [Devosia oryzisoli]